MLWATLFIFFSILYMEVFGLTKEGGANYTRFQNYYTFGNSLVMLAFMSTGSVSLPHPAFRADHAARAGTATCTISELLG